MQAAGQQLPIVLRRGRRTAQQQFVRALAQTIERLSRGGFGICGLEEFDFLSPHAKPHCGAIVPTGALSGITILVEKSGECGCRSVECRSDDREPVNPRHWHAMVDFLPLRHTLLTWGHILDDERKCRLANLRLLSERSPSQLTSVRPKPAAIHRPQDAETSALARLRVSKQTVRPQRVVDEPFAVYQPRPPGMGRRTLRLAEGDQFEVCAVGKGDQGILGCTARMLAPRDHGETGGTVVRYRLSQISYKDHHVVDSRKHQIPLVSR